MTTSGPRTNQKIKEYWEERARTYGGGKATTTEDVYLRELEVQTITRSLQEVDFSEGATVLDVGCGDGYSTVSIAGTVPRRTVLGIDYSEGMIRLARQRLDEEPELKNRVEFEVGEVNDLGQVLAHSTYDIVTSDRCLINLESAGAQSDAITQIAEHTRPRGYFIAIENFTEGHENMNEARRSVGLPPIPVRWHNLYFREKEFLRAVDPFFGDVTFKDFSSSYYYATRVIYSAMCQMRGETPDYLHEIHQLAVRLPWFGQFSPIRMAIMRRRSD